MFSKRRTIPREDSPSHHTIRAEMSYYLTDNSC
nr:MAG TPA: hypothetical protein [Caudoviricetes sp.]